MPEVCFVVDDEPIEAMAVEMILQEQFPELAVYRATSSIKALEMMKNVKPDLFIVDIQMPGLNGLDLIKEVKHHHPKARALIISAYDAFEYAQKAIQLDAKQYLLKPAQREELVETVRKQLDDIRFEKRMSQEQFLTKEKLELSEPYLEREWLHAIMGQSMEEGEFERLTDLLGLREACGRFIVLKGKGEKPLRSDQELKTFWEARYPRVLETFSDGCRVLLILFALGKEQNGEEEHMEQHLIRFSERFSHQWDWGIGDTARGTEKFRLSYQKALAELEGQRLLKRKIERFLQGGFRHDLKIEEAAKEANLSVHYFSKWFKKQFGKNFSEYLLELRVNHAIWLLTRTDLSVKEISYRSGFNDPNYFSKIFKKVTGEKPKAFRQRESVK